MPNQRLVDYIQRHLNKGLSKESIRNHLINSGWPEYDVEEAFSSLHQYPDWLPESEERAEQKKGKEQRKNSGSFRNGRPAKWGFIFTLLGGATMFFGLGIVLLFSAMNPFGVSLFSNFIVLIFAVLLPFILGLALILNSLKMRKGDRTRKFGIATIIYGIVLGGFGALYLVYSLNSGSATSPIQIPAELVAGIFALIGGILAVKNR